MFQTEMSEIANSRVVSIGEPASRARNLALNRTTGTGRPLSLVDRLGEAAAALQAKCTDSADPWLFENRRYVFTHVRQLRKLLRQAERENLPIVSDGPLFGYPRIFEIAVELQSAGEFSIEATAAFIDDYQSIAPLTIAELWALDTMLRLAIVEELARATRNFGPLILSLKEVNAASWQDFFEAHSRAEQILREDPIGIYAAMDFATRDRYRHVIEDVARRSPHSEEEVARAAIVLSGTAGAEAREGHVGYHLIDKGAPRLKAGLQYRPPLRTRLTDTIRNWPTAFYLIGIELTTLALAVYLLSFHKSRLGEIGLILFLLATEPAIALLNALTVYLIPPQRLPKLDFSEGIPAEYSTMVIVPTLLLSEKFIQKLLNDLEVRFLANRDPRLTFALLTDFPDAASPDSDDTLAEACATGVRLLNERYTSENRQPFYLFHRRREWNPKQGAWMGWERKRGKLVALNNLLRGEDDAFSIKIGDLSILSGIRYVITLDSDTELPRGTAQQLVGTLAHPLNRAVIDPETNTVREGYGILQPRVGISVASARRSRLAAIYSGQTGFDLYSTAVSDVYQDLFNEGSYVGKGIYDVDVFQKTLAKRFPGDILLSHDLIEGTHARAGLVSDIELIDDYPSHYSAWSKRKHRWVRGDWQIMQWLLPLVPDYNGKRVPNPLSIVSLWKILDNLRRSLIEIAIFVLLIAGWTFLPGGAVYWTTVVIVVSLLPVYLGTAFSILRTPFTSQWRAHVWDTLSGFFSGHVDVGLRLVFLAHQTCLMLDAILRSLIRVTTTGTRLLEWESAAQAEMGSGPRVKSIDSYLWLAMPVALIVGAIVAITHRQSLPVAMPFLIAWLVSPLVALWLNASLYVPKQEIDAQDHAFLRGVALRTWQYFAEFSVAEDSWLIPDNVEEENTKIAHRVSPTNIGLLLNAHLAACDFGYLSQREFVTNVGRVLASLDRLERHNGHFYNWYDTGTLAPLCPRYVSTVDSGNLAASLITLRQGLLEQLKRPVIDRSLAEAAADRMPGAKLPATPTSLPEWRTWLRDIQPERLAELDAIAPGDSIHEFTNVPTLGELPAIYDLLLARPNQPLAQELALARDRAILLLRNINAYAHRCSELVGQMDFSFLFHPKRKVFHIGFDVETQQLDPSRYDLLASESRIASFIAIAKSDVPQENWLRLGRALVLADGRRALLSWSGTMFEYLMPLIWMKNFPNSLLDRATRAAVRCQRAYARRRRVPWGISESACSERVNGGDYRYHAFGVPDLALRPGQESHLVIAPYASVLALMTDPKAATANLKRQAAEGLLTRHGFYEAVDFTTTRTVVRSYMAHHQGMSLLSLDNVLNGSCMQERFHLEPMVQATELLLHERIGRAVPVEKPPAVPVQEVSISLSANVSAA
jgi:cyclic beta-1,2-glucan synthetase